MIFNALTKCLWVDSTKGEAAFSLIFKKLDITH